MQVKPLQDRVLVERQEEETKTVGGIIIPDNNKEKPSRGVVVAVGRGRTLDNGDTKPVEVKAGDVVIFGKYVGTEVKVEQNEYIIMKEDEILGVIQ